MWPSEVFFNKFSLKAKRRVLLGRHPLLKGRRVYLRGRASVWIFPKIYYFGWIKPLVWKRFSPSFVALSLFPHCIYCFSVSKGTRRIRGLDGDDQYVKYTVGSLTENFVSPSDSFTTVNTTRQSTLWHPPKIFVDSASWQFSLYSIFPISHLPATIP